ncbi:MAG: hypothetical protein K2Y29_05035 [Beijerinckiaceae bacterium]|nr:hypothetical protein [Beijerinckiaceae bacterium]
MRYVENEGALFRIRGPSNAFPNEVWSAKEKKFVPYEGYTPKPVSWGQDISEEEALAFIAEEIARD